jgi:hypothetical protein
MELTFEQIQDQRQLIRDEVSNLIENSEWEVDSDDAFDGYVFVTICKKKD